MQTFEVWHRNDPSFRDNEQRALARTFPAGFTHVADVTVEHVEQVFEKTNHIDSTWTSNKGVVVTKGMRRKRIRSTSVGDVYIRRSVGGTVTHWSVDSVGLTVWHLSTRRRKETV